MANMDGSLHSSNGGRGTVGMRHMEVPVYGVQASPFSPQQQQLQSPSPNIAQRSTGVQYQYHAGQPGGGDHDKLVSELMHEVETKRGELESMTMSVVQWKQTFKDKLQQEKLELQASGINERSLIKERMSLRMFQLHGRLLLAVAFQKLREHRKQVLWLQRVKELKGQCEVLREEASIAAINCMSASQEFSQQEFAQRILSSLSQLVAIAQGHDLDGEGWILSDIVAVGNAVLGEKLRQLLNVIQQVRANESSLQRRTADLMQGNGAVAQLQDRIDSLERELHGKRKAVETLSMQLDVERDSSMDISRRSSKASPLVKESTSHGIRQELTALSDAKSRLEEENAILKRKLMEMEDSNNALRKQLVDARREMPTTPGNDQRKDDIIKNLSAMRDNAENKARALQDDLRIQGSEITTLKKELQDARARVPTPGSPGEVTGAHGQAQANDLLQLIHLRATAEKRADEAEANLKLEQQNILKLKQEVKMLESRLSEPSTRRSDYTTSISNSPSMKPRDSQNSTMSLASTSQSSANELQRMQRELKVMTELKEAALLSLESLRTELVEGVTNIEFPNLRVESKIGSGSFAEVYRGEWTRPCAIKKLRGLTKRRQLQDFYREAQILQMLNHTGVVQLMGICMNIPELYLVTELVVGGSLEELLHVEKRKLSMAEIMSISMQIADAMQFLHMANVVHRDLKPSNCLIDHHGVVKLCDFGLARVVGKEPSSSSENSRAGTPVYLAPEALQGAPTTNKVDIYSFSIIMWEMLTGEQAWVTLDYKQMVAAVVRDRKRPPVPPDTSIQAKELLDQCWAQEPNERPTFTAIVVHLSEMGAPKPMRQSKSTPFKNVELV